MQLLKPISHRRRRSSSRDTGWIGIEIGTAAIRIAQLERGEYCSHIAREITVNAEEDRPFDVISFDEGRIGQEIRQALNLHGGFRGRNVACALAMNFCGLRTLAIANGTDSERRELIGLELDPKIPTARRQESQEFDFWNCSSEPANEDGMTQVHVISLESSLASAVGRNLLDAGLKCQVLDGIPFAMSRAANMSKDSDAQPSSPIAVLDLDHASATLTISQHGQPLLTRHFRECGLDRLVTAIRKRLAISSSETETLLTWYGLEAGEDLNEQKGVIQGVVSEMASDLLQEIESEIKHTLTYFKMQMRGPAVSQLTLVGAGASIANINHRFSRSVGIPVACWKLNDACPDSSAPMSVFANAAALSSLAWEK